MTCPCLGCTDRKVTLDYHCHSKGNCPRFEEWKKLDEKRAVNERKAKETYGGSRRKGQL